MKYENEITVKVVINYDELTNLLLSQGFNLAVDTILDDTYMTNKDINNTDIQELLHTYIIIRDSGSTGPMVTYKYKEFNEDNSIKKQGKIELKVESIEKSKQLFTELGYTEFIFIHNHVKIFEKDNIKLVATEVNNEYICIEYSSSNEQPIENLINEFKQFNIPYDDSNYFLNKAIIELQKKKAVQ